MPSPAYGFVQRLCPGPRAPLVLTHNPALGKPEALEKRPRGWYLSGQLFTAPKSGQNCLLQCPCRPITWLSGSQVGEGTLETSAVSSRMQGLVPVPPETSCRDLSLGRARRPVQADIAPWSSPPVKQRKELRTTQVFGQAGEDLGIPEARIHLAGLGSQTSDCERLPKAAAMCSGRVRCQRTLFSTWGHHLGAGD